MQTSTSPTRMQMYRTWQFSQMRWAIPTTRQMVDNITREQAHRLRRDGVGWTVVEVVCHLRDFDRLFRERVEVTLRQEYPELPFPNPDKLARERNYNALSLDLALNQWEVAREELIITFEAIGEEETLWDRIGAHPVRGSFSINDQLMLVPQHDMLHLNQIVEIIQLGI